MNEESSPLTPPTPPLHHPIGTSIIISIRNGNFAFPVDDFHSQSLNNKSYCFFFLLLKSLWGNTGEFQTVDDRKLIFCFIYWFIETTASPDYVAIAAACRSSGLKRSFELTTEQFKNSESFATSFGRGGIEFKSNSF